MKGQGSFLLSRIPCDEQGKAFLALFRKHLNRTEFDMTVRANGPRAEPARKAGLNPRSFDQSLPIALAEHVRIYVTPKRKPPVPIRNVPQPPPFPFRESEHIREGDEHPSHVVHLTRGHNLQPGSYFFSPGETESDPQAEQAAFRAANAMEAAKRMTDQAKSDMAVLHAINDELRRTNASLHAENADLHARYAELLFGNSLWERIRHVFVRLMERMAHGKD